MQISNQEKWLIAIKSREEQVFTGILNKKIAEDLMIPSWRRTNNKPYTLTYLDKTYKIGQKSEYGYGKNKVPSGTDFIAEIITKDPTDIESFKRFFPEGYVGLKEIHLYFSQNSKKIENSCSSIESIYEKSIWDIINNAEYEFNAMYPYDLQTTIETIMKKCFNVTEKIHITNAIFKFDKFTEYITTQFPLTYDKLGVKNFLLNFSTSRNTFNYSERLELRSKIRQCTTNNFNGNSIVGHKETRTLQCELDDYDNQVREIHINKSENHHCWNSFQQGSD